jgi:hypothetical protein
MLLNGKKRMNKQPLIYHKKQMYYLLSNANPEHLLDSERALLAVLQDDIELMAELEYKSYMEGE